MFVGIPDTMCLTRGLGDFLDLLPDMVGAKVADDHRVKSKLYNIHRVSMIPPLRFFPHQAKNQVGWLDLWVACRFCEVTLGGFTDI